MARKLRSVCLDPKQNGKTAKCHRFFTRTLVQTTGSSSTRKDVRVRDTAGLQDGVQEEGVGHRGSHTYRVIQAPSSSSLRQGPGGQAGVARSHWEVGGGGGWSRQEAVLPTSGAHCWTQGSQAFAAFPAPGHQWAWAWAWPSDQTMLRPLGTHRLLQHSKMVLCVRRPLELTLLPAFNDLLIVRGAVMVFDVPHRRSPTLVPSFVKIRPTLHQQQHQPHATALDGVPQQIHGFLRLMRLDLVDAALV
mmetsp:Transcript_43213/g.70396  ORF Transcript_43213/g.70396 Transcript_43213/m.70396 type:complete len:247 (-) Transcript_43213:1545-2285(-)